MKKCRTCKENKPLEAFGRNARSKDKRADRCKECIVDDDKRIRKNFITKQRAETRKRDVEINNLKKRMIYRLISALKDFGNEE